jgi:hypothetical protein
MLLALGVRRATRCQRAVTPTTYDLGIGPAPRFGPLDMRGRGLYVNCRFQSALIGPDRQSLI